MNKPRRYRIVTDRYQGFEVQVKGVFGWRMPACNTHATIEKAEAYANQDAAKHTADYMVKDLGFLPRESAK